MRGRIRQLVTVGRADGPELTVVSREIVDGSRLEAVRIRTRVTGTGQGGPGEAFVLAALATGVDRAERGCRARRRHDERHHDKACQKPQPPSPHPHSLPPAPERPPSGRPEDRVAPGMEATSSRRGDHRPAHPYEAQVMAAREVYDQSMTRHHRPCPARPPAHRRTCDPAASKLLHGPLTSTGGRTRWVAPTPTAQYKCADRPSPRWSMRRRSTTHPLAIDTPGCRAGPPGGKRWDHVQGQRPTCTTPTADTTGGALTGRTHRPGTHPTALAAWRVGRAGDLRRHTSSRGSVGR